MQAYNTTKNVEREVIYTNKTKEKTTRNVTDPNLEGMRMAEYIDREEYCEKHCRCSNEYCDKESCPIWKAPAADVAPIEALERLRDEMCAQDLITMEGLRKLNTLIWKYTTVHDGGQCE